MCDVCVLAHTSLFKGHLVSHCTVEVGIDVYRLDQRLGSERLDLLQFDKYEHCKHIGLALSCFHSVKITLRGTGPGHWYDMRLLWMMIKGWQHHKRSSKIKLYVWVCVFSNNRNGTVLCSHTLTHRHYYISWHQIILKKMSMLSLPFLIAYPWFNRSFPWT